MKRSKKFANILGIQQNEFHYILLFCYKCSFPVAFYRVLFQEVLDANVFIKFKLFHDFRTIDILNCSLFWKKGNLEKEQPLIYAIGAWITAAGGTRLALQWFHAKWFTVCSFRLPGLGCVWYCYLLSQPRPSASG